MMQLPIWLNQKNVMAAVHSLGSLLVALGLFTLGQESRIETAVTVGLGAVLTLGGAAHNVTMAIRNPDPVKPVAEDPPAKGA